MNIKFIPQIQPWIDNAELKEITKVINSTYITEGEATRIFEEKIKKLTKSKYCIAISNGTLALTASLLALGIKRKDEIIVPNMTFIASANAVILTGATPVLCDITENNFCLDLFKAEKLITKNTKAIMPVHLYGQAAQINEIKNFAKKHKLFLIEDASQGVGVKFDNKHLGTFGDLGVLSFYGNKTITTAEGGAVLTQKKSLYEKIYKLKNHGRIKKGTFIHEEIGYNFAFNDLQAAIGIAQLNKLKKIVKKKKKILNYYDSFFKKKKIPLLKILIDPKCSPVHWFSSFICKETDELSLFLKKNNIQTRRFFFPLNEQPCYQNSKKIKNLKGNFKNSKFNYDYGISLPSSYNLNMNEQKIIVKLISEFYENRN